MRELQNLSSQEYQLIFDQIIDGKLSDIQIKNFLVDLNKAQLPANAFIGAIQSFKPRCANLNFFPEAIDVCGTGGDKLNTLNISTAVAFVVAACDVLVVKHGNKAISSRSGSADVLLELGIDITTNKYDIEKSLQKNNLCFMFAPLYHSSFKSLVKIRSELALPTIFNFLGPLLNPANVKFQLIGTSKKETMPLMLQALQKTGSEKVFIVSGLDGMDEITITDNSLLLTLENDKIEPAEIIKPENYGIIKSPLSQICGGNAKYNAKKLIDLLNGEYSAYFDVVVLNSAFVLLLVGKVKSVIDGILLSTEAIKSGKSKNILKNMQES